MIDRSNEVKSDDTMMAEVGIWVLVSFVILIGGIPLLYYVRYVRLIVNVQCSFLYNSNGFIIRNHLSKCMFLCQRNWPSEFIDLSGEISNFLFNKLFFIYIWNEYCDIHMYNVMYLFIDHDWERYYLISHLINTQLCFGSNWRRILPFLLKTKKKKNKSRSIGWLLSFFSAFNRYRYILTVFFLCLSATGDLNIDDTIQNWFIFSFVTCSFVL